MYRHGLRRCARTASSWGAAVPLARQRPLAAIARHCAVPSARSIAHLKSIASVGRLYSTEATATEQSAPSTGSTSNEPVELFKDLPKLGVHQNLIDSITQDMGYERMTPVQAKTINPALKGTDMYCHLPGLLSTLALTEYLALPKPRPVLVKRLHFCCRFFRECSTKTHHWRQGELPALLPATIFEALSCHPPVSLQSRLLPKHVPSQGTPDLSFRLLWEVPTRVRCCARPRGKAAT